MTDANSPEQEVPIVCSFCQTGKKQLTYVTYLTWLGDELITVPNFPAWICDVCGRRDYDERAVAWLTALLKPDAGRDGGRRRRVLPQAEARKDGGRQSLPD